MWGDPGKSLGAKGVHNTLVEWCPLGCCHHPWPPLGTCFQSLLLLCSLDLLGSWVSSLPLAKSPSPTGYKAGSGCSGNVC